MGKKKLITIEGITKSIQEWADTPGVTVTYNTIRYRLEKGWTPKDAVFKRQISKSAAGTKGARRGGMRGWCI